MKIVVDTFNIVQKRKYHLLKIWVLLWYALSRAVHKNRTSQVRFSPSKPDLIRPKNACMIVICFLQLLIEPWKSNDRLHGIPGHDPARESRKTPLEGGRKFMQGERRTQHQLVKMASWCGEWHKASFTRKTLCVTAHLMWTFWPHEVNCYSLNQCRQFVHIDSVRVTFDLDLTFCQATVKSGKCCFSVLTKWP